MNPRLNQNRHRRGWIIQCIIVVLVLVVAGIIVRMIIRFCKDHFPPKPGGTNTNSVIEMPLPPRFFFTNDHTAAPAGLTNRNPRAYHPCPLNVNLNASDLLTNAQFFLQRSTNLTDWQDLQQVFPDVLGNCEFCETNPPWPQAFYRLRARLSE